MKKANNKILNICLPVAIYIACSLLAFLCWYIFDYGTSPIVSTSIIFCVLGSFFSGFFAKGKNGKIGMFITIGIVAVSVLLWIFAYTFSISVCAYIATVFSSYFFNIQSCLYFDEQLYFYIGYAVSLICPIILILFGRFLNTKLIKEKI